MPKLKNLQSVLAFLAVTTIGNLIFAPVSKIVAAANHSPKSVEGKIVASLEFDPEVNGFGFENYGNDHRNWQDDLGAEDMIRLFGTKAVCKVGNTPQNCVMKAAAREWMNKQLEGMDGGHCEGLAATSLRFMLGKDFKGKIRPIRHRTIWVWMVMDSRRPDSSVFVLVRCVASSCVAKAPSAVMSPGRCWSRNELIRL